MEDSLVFKKSLSKLDLPFWVENLGREKKRLKELLEFSNGVEHSATMDARRNIQRYEDKIKEIGVD